MADAYSQLKAKVVDFEYGTMRGLCQEFLIPRGFLDGVLVWVGTVGGRLRFYRGADIRFWKYLLLV